MSACDLLLVYVMANWLVYLCFELVKLLWCMYTHTHIDMDHLEVSYVIRCVLFKFRPSQAAFYDYLILPLSWSLLLPRTEVVLIFGCFLILGLKFSDDGFFGSLILNLYILQLLLV